MRTNKKIQAMRTNKEIQLAITTFNKELETVPQFSHFNDDNHQSINLMIEVLEKELDEDALYDKQEDEGIEQHTIDDAIGVLEWLRGDVELEDIVWNQDNIITELPPTDKIKVCPSLCGDCPFSVNSMRGWLANYTVQDFIDMVSEEISFPCHKMMKEGCNSDETKKAIDTGEMKLCRGYIECLIKSSKMPYKNEQIVEVIKIVQKEGVSEKSMDLHEFTKHHNINQKTIA